MRYKCGSRVWNDADAIPHREYTLLLGASRITIKEYLVWIKEFDSFAEFEAALKQWPKATNEDYPHSSLNYMTPYEYERWFNASIA